MSEQQYRVVADRDKGDDPRWEDVRVGDRYVGIATERGTPLDPVLRIERLVPTICTCPPPATHMEDGPDQDCPKHDDRVSPPLVQIVSPRATGKRSALLDAVLDRADERGIQVQVVPSPSLPTREQIADRLIERLRNSGGWPVDEVWQRWQNLFVEYDRDLSLLQKGVDR